MNKKINIFSSIDLSMLGDELDFLKKKTNLSFSLDSKYQKIGDADIYISSAKVKVDKKFLNNSKKLRLILSPSTGTDHLDMNEIKKRKIKCIHIAKERKLLDTFTATSELVFALLLFINRSLVQNYFSAISGNWIRDKFTARQLYGKTLGIIGLGRLGKITAKIANGFGMKVIGFDKNKKIKLNKVKNVSLNTLLIKSDVISLHIHLNKKNENFINRKKISIMKADATLINTSRGKIINEKDLLYYLKLRKKFKAGLDVIDGEWLSKKDLKQHKLIKYANKNDNLIIVPHIGGATNESIYGARSFIINKLKNEIKNL
jgi:D-3-phosphoglycerate dehydrogenase / 2-oxoglutarate reductase